MLAKNSTTGWLSDNRGCDNEEGIGEAQGNSEEDTRSGATALSLSTVFAASQDAEDEDARLPVARSRDTASLRRPLLFRRRFNGVAAPHGESPPMLLLLQLLLLTGGLPSGPACGGAQDDAGRSAVALVDRCEVRGVAAAFPSSPPEQTPLKTEGAGAPGECSEGC